MLSSIFSDPSLETWLLNKIELGSKWYDTLNELIIDTKFDNIDTIKTQLDNEKCLELLNSKNSVNKFTLNIVDCNEKRVPICRIHPLKIANPSKPPKFPCIEKNKAARRKRGANNLDNQNGKIMCIIIKVFLLVQHIK